MANVNRSRNFKIPILKMKNMKMLKRLSILLMLIAIIGCSKEQEEILDGNKTQKTNAYNKNGGITSNEFIVKYIPDLTEAQKQILRDKYGVLDIKKCPCADPTLELWRFKEGIDPKEIEERKNTAHEDPELEGTSFNSKVKLQDNGFESQLFTGNLEIAKSRMVDANQNIAIAILDTGVDYVNGGFTGNFLYNNDNDLPCGESGQTDIFGWDFVNGDNDPFDDNNHGTFVTRIVHDKLVEKGVQNSILPVKVFDKNGNAEDFDILCGFKYALKKPEVRIINLSFGGGFSNALMDSFIEEERENVLIITSAGNTENDNDIIPHYPSSYDDPNILTVAAFGNATSINPLATNNVYLLAEYSNYGKLSVDIAAPGGPYELNINEVNFEIEGTSFACAYATYKGASLYVPGLTPAGLRNVIIGDCTVFVSGLDDIRYKATLLQ